MRIADLTAYEGAESKRRGARNPATSDAAPSSRASRGGSRGNGRGRRGAADEPELVAPVRIMSVAEDPRVKGRVRVRCQALGESRTLVIGASGVRAFNIRTGMTLDGVAWAGLLRESRVVRAQDAALRMLSTSRRSTRDLELRLRRREQDPTVIADAIGRLASLGLLNDEEFALAEAAAQLRYGARSTGAVKRRLQQRGVERTVADAAVAEVVEREGVNDAERCEEAATKRVRQLRGLDRAVAQRRLIGFLMRRGFSPDLVYAASKRATSEWSADGAVTGDGDAGSDMDDALAD
jgi:regulatory protein